MAPLRSRMDLKAAGLGLAFAAMISSAFAASETKADAQAPSLTDEQVESARDLFRTWSCASCHKLADAQAMGPIGPSLDNNPNLTYEYVVSRITNGQGAMPPFGGQLTEKEIADLSAYIMQVAKK
ncbi:c-type cytochrome [Hyphococcus luteus]|uniref:Cytochrome c domain-containing protein n=1 Tax=Hyphococcus luteus TaxID=2058213 RepID=A0A2S7KAL3_9PROT|nr:cytochrome c [Marinicaulis flavus]PQA89556.1 hypothetical protein CW354_01410 [Marinicaulis flavus]